MSKSHTNLQAKSFDHFFLSDMGWLPYNIRYDDAELVVDWCYSDDSLLEDPFFDQTIYRLLQFTAHASRSTLFTTLVDINSKKISRRPTGFIFHMSRCGSTLIAQMLASLRQVVVFSEPTILETVLQKEFLPFTFSPLNEQKQWLLENIIQALLSYKADWQNAFIKFSARAIFDYPLITQIYPSMPCIFVYREPVEVLVSLIGTQTEKLPPGLDKAGLLKDDSNTISRMRPIEFWARVLANQCAAAVEMCTSSQPLLINYSQLPEIMWTDIASFLGIMLSAEDVERMREVPKRSAKEPHKTFIDDRAKKRKAATREMHEFADRFIRPYYHQLETIRLAPKSYTNSAQ
jgi:hypothetical protein